MRRILHRPSASPPRKVLYLAWAPFFSGAERALLLLVQNLDPRRYEPFVVVGNDGELRAHLSAASIPNAYVPIWRSDWRHPLRWGASTLRVAALARSQGTVLVHSNETPGFHPAGYAARLLRIPAVAHVRFPDGDFRWFLKPGFQSAVFVSRYLLSDALSDYGNVFDGRAEVIHDGVLLPDLPSERERSSGRATLGISPTQPAVLLAGQVAEIKGIWEYIEAARILSDAGNQAIFVVMGDDMRGKGELRRRAEEKVRALGLEARFRFLGFRQDAAQLVPLFDIAAVPSHVEPLGNATLEAMAAGLPVVGSNVGGIPEMIVDRLTGVLVPARDPVALAGAIGELVTDRDLRARFGAAGRKRAASEFGIERHVERVQHLYDRLLD